ncbi:Aldehyde/histidinol dehydrogenase [Hysterangium stoloniferum]|nr:Aldehyde/histidinol dehydrogenase [Hysterangium stoloniferum]
MAKSSEFPPRLAEIIVELLYESTHRSYNQAGLPKGVFSLLHVSREDSPKVVEQIISHELIRHVNVRMFFHQTLSLLRGDRIGEIIAMAAAKDLTPCVLELGSKSAVAEAKGIIMGAVANSGMHVYRTSNRAERCAGAPSPTPTAIASIMKTGTEPTCPLVPLVTAAAAKCVAALLADAKERGGKLLVGDLTAQGAVLAILQPHIISGVDEDWPIWTQETFGPVFVVRVVDTEEEAIALANKTPYTLSGAIWTRNMDNGLKLAHSIRACTPFCDECKTKEATPFHYVMTYPKYRAQKDKMRNRLEVPQDMPLFTDHLSDGKNIPDLLHYADGSKVFQGSSME